MNKDQLAKELRLDEGFIPYSYKDHLGYDTIGIGRLCDKRKPGSGLTEDEALYLLKNDIDKRYVELKAKLPWFVKLTDVRQRSLVNMAFQLGVNGLMGFKNSLASLEAALVTGDYDRAADNFLKSKWAEQTPQRAKRVTDMIRKG